MKLILKMRLSVLVILAVLLTACKHPLSILGEGDIVERLAGVRGCTLEDFQASSQRCTENEVIAEDYAVSYEAIPRPGWHLVGWTNRSGCSADDTPLFCDISISQDWVEHTDQTWPEIEFPAATAVFTQTGMLGAFTHKMIKNTDDSLFSNLAYECTECSIAQQATIEPPTGWSKGPVQVALPIGTLLSTPSVEGEPTSVDFLPDMPGNEYKLIAVVRSGHLLESGGGGPVNG